MAATESPRRLALLGGCGGIGRGVMAAALAEGWQVAVLDLPASLARHPPPAGVLAVPLDAADEAQVAAAFATVGREFGGLEGFVNLAGFMSPMGALEGQSADAFDEVMAGNLRGAFLACRAVLPLLRAGRDAALVNIASGLAQFIRPNYGPYAAAKAGIIALTKTLAVENAPAIRANCVAPGAVDTAFLRGGTGRSEENEAPHVNIGAYSNAIPMKRIAEVEDVVGPVMFLLTRPSRYMTGQVLWVNGGAYMP